MGLGRPLDSIDHTIRLWDAKTGAETARLDGHSELCVLPDGRLASGSDDHTIRLWDLSTCVETVRLETDAPIHSLIALPSGGLVAGDHIGRLHWLGLIEVCGPR